MDDRKSHSAELDFLTKALQVSKTHRRLNPELLEPLKYLEYYPKDSVVKFLEVACPILTVETLQLAESPHFVKRLVPDLNPNLITHSLDSGESYDTANFLINSRLIINSVTEGGHTPLTATIRMQHPQLRSKIWRLGTRLVIPGDTACRCGRSLCATALTAAILEGNVDIAHLLLKKRACPNRHPSASIDSVLPLAAAIITSNIQMAQTLLLAGAASYDQLALDSISLELGLGFHQTVAGLPSELLQRRQAVLEFDFEQSHQALPNL
ncbi:uncharacterized protein QC763_0102270 [Podospora pseudopauciseta]|uniref:Uncharacterized protein n=1 Tax=Podospora pseudopauciseta TaxID=2093780 RepID=A0ABR0H061_9PEZI|nr:hypothetical protein QC763_0102270 [Podospora pseudopauciseta]